MATGGHKETGNQGKKGLRRGVVKKEQVSFANENESEAVLWSVLEHFGNCDAFKNADKCKISGKQMLSPYRGQRQES